MIYRIKNAAHTRMCEALADGSTLTLADLRLALPTYKAMGILPEFMTAEQVYPLLNLIRSRIELGEFTIDPSQFGGNPNV
jgi:hypothetical protein